jgi:hypothetical protein
MKQNLAEFAGGLATDPRQVERFQSEAKRYSAEKDGIKKEAETLEAQVKEADGNSQHALHPHERLSISMTLLQIAIALASITVLTQKRWLLWLAAAAAFAGSVMGVVAWF